MEELSDMTQMSTDCRCATKSCEWVYADGCKIYGPSSPHGFVGPWQPDHEHDLITATQCEQCGDIVEFDPPAKTIKEADECIKTVCS
jgi:hypothetical protein